MLPLVVALRASVNTFSPPICTAAGAAGCGACSLGGAGCCRHPAASRADAARTLPNHRFTLYIDPLKNLCPLPDSGSEESKNSSYAVFQMGLTIGYEHLPQANPGSPVGSPGCLRPILAQPPPSLSPLVLFNQEVIRCHRCTRLRKYCEDIATSKRRAYRDWIYWAKPVPSFGDEKARLLILGLAPGAHGSNRTGRPFTGDGSGDFLYPVLHDAGFASQPNSVSRGDGMKLQDCWISAVVRCAPPDNTPKRSELKNCAPYLDQEIALLTNLRVVVCLGRIAFDSYLEHLTRYRAE